uniref:HMA domain-containing protein n=1 Tax=Oryza punctata TaxID=4537 RepID=A0A0E0KRP1_ORYPU
MKEIIIRMRPDYDKSHHKALKVAAAVSGVESVTVAGRDRDLLLVIGDGVDESKLTKKLRREVGEAEILELRTLDAGGGRGSGGAASMQLMTTAAGDGKGGAIVFAQSSPYHWHGHHTTPGRSVPGGGRITCPVTPTAAAASPGSARWPGGEQYRRGRRSLPLRPDLALPPPELTSVCVAARTAAAGRGGGAAVVARGSQARAWPSGLVMAGGGREDGSGVASAAEDLPTAVGAAEDGGGGLGRRWLPSAPATRDGKGLSTMDSGGQEFQ